MADAETRDHGPAGEHRPATGQPTRDPDPIGDSDFADEHEVTAVSDDVITGADDDDREPESPRGWSGMQR